MKFGFALIALAATVSAMAEIDPNSDAGRHLLSKARRLDDGDNYQLSWVAGYSVKFQGCHSIKQWNDEANGEDDVRLATKNLVRFRLCPVETCSSTKAAGCNSGYGDYIIDMATFMESYIEASQQIREYNCQTYLYNSCNCQDDGNQGDDFNEEYCEYDCFNNAGKAECIERNPYDENGEEQERFEMQEYMECRQLEINNNNNGNRRAEENQQEEVKYYVGPYCSNDGGGIYLGLFTDETCSEKAVDVTFRELMGYDLPYDAASMVDASCVSCLETNWDNEQNNNNNNNGGDAYDEDTVREQCENLYTMSGKCESQYPDGMVAYPNTNACTYMEGVKIVRQDGIIDRGAARPSGVATAFIVISAMCFVAMGFYVWYLRTRLGVKKNTLL